MHSAFSGITENSKKIWNAQKQQDNSLKNEILKKTKFSIAS